MPSVVNVYGHIIANLKVRFKNMARKKNVDKERYFFFFRVAYSSNGYLVVSMNGFRI